MSEDRTVDEAPRPEGPAGTAVKSSASPLRAALNRARQQEAERSDVIVDLREAELARLELLQDALSDVFDALPEDNDLLECSVIPSTPPRLWIDVLGHVVMGRDKRTYRFLKDTRYGRQVILETTSLEEMAGRVTDYVAHRLLERQRALESDTGGRSPAVRPERTVSDRTPAGQMPMAHDETVPDAEPAYEADAALDVSPAQEPEKPSGVGVWVTIFAFVLGAAAGAVGLVAAGLILTAP